MKSMTTLITQGIKNLLLFSYYLIWLLLDPCKFKKIKEKEIKKILIIHLGATGELFFVSLLFPALKKALNCEISLMVSKGKEYVLKDNPYISEILVYQNNFKKDIKEIKKRNFDLAIILYPGSLKISLICFIAGIRYRIGCFGNIKGGPPLFLTRRVFPANHKKIPFEETLAMIEQIGIYNKHPKLEFYISNKEQKDLKKILKKLKVKDYIIVHPGFNSFNKYKYPSRLWPLERYAEIVDYLIEKYKVKVFLTGNQDEKIISEQIKEKVKNKKQAIIANDLFGLRGLIALISKAKLLFSCGTCVVHIAASFDIPLVTFIGKSNPIESSIHNPKKNYIILFHPEVCTECEREYCRKKTIECLKAVTTKEVKNSIDELMRRNYKKRTLFKKIDNRVSIAP